MKKADVKIGNVYGAKVSGKVVPVRIDAESAHGGWTGTNQATGKQVRIKSAQRLRYAMAKKNGKWRRVDAGGGKDATRANVGGDTATQGNAKKERKNAPRAKRSRQGAKRTSLLDAAATVLAAANGPVNCKQMVEAVLERGLWQTEGATPSATLHSALSRHIAKKGKESRFRKVDRGLFDLAR